MLVAVYSGSRIPTDAFIQTNVSSCSGDRKDDSGPRITVNQLINGHNHMVILRCLFKKLFFIMFELISFLSCPVPKNPKYFSFSILSLS